MEKFEFYEEVNIDIKNECKRFIEENKQIENTNQRLRKLIEINKEQSSVTNRLALASEMEKSISKTKEEALSLIRSLPEVIKPEKQKERRRKRR